ncbi:MAG TPA: hypothetical protein PKY82_15135 [Pyrinomonadaceae bacterium]|nr:hypothetical protein [Pyrinomonadaceae bacterium]
MNTNQEVSSNIPSATSILSSFLGKKKVMSEEKTEVISEPVSVVKVSPAAEILNRLNTKKEKAAVTLGITTAEVETMPFDLSQLETEGIFLNVDCRGFSTLERQIEWKSLGVELPTQGAVKLSPPRVGLLPDNYRRKLMRAGSQAHHALNKFSFRFTLCETVWGTSEYKWIPWNAFENFEQEYKRALETLAAAKAEVLANYDEILLTLRKSFAELATNSAKRLDATLEIPLDREEFIANVVAHALGMIPTQEMIRDGLTISMKPKVIVLGSEMLAEQQTAKSLTLETAKIEAEHQSVRLEFDTKTRIEQIKIHDFELEQRREREVKERIRQMKIEAARDAANDAISPIKEGLDQITAKIFEAAQEMAQKLQTADFVPGALAKRARQMCEWYRLMNFTGDSSLEEVLERLQTAAGAEAKHRSRVEMQSALNDVLRATSLQSKRLLDEDRLSALEI